MFADTELVPNGDGVELVVLPKGDGVVDGVKLPNPVLVVPPPKALLLPKALVFPKIFLLTLLPVLLLLPANEKVGGASVLTAKGLGLLSSLSGCLL